MIRHSKLVHVSLGAYALRREMAQHWLGNVLLMLPATAHAYCVIAISSARLVADNLILFELKNRTRGTLASLSVVDSSHAFLDG